MLYFGPWPLPPYCCKDSVIFIVNGRSIFNQIFAYAGICGWPMQSAHLWHATGHNGPHPVSHEPPKTARQEQRPMRPGSGSAAQQGFEDGAASALGSGAAGRLSMPLLLSVGPRTCVAPRHVCFYLWHLHSYIATNHSVASIPRRGRPPWQSPIGIG